MAGARESTQSSRHPPWPTWAVLAAIAFAASPAAADEKEACADAAEAAQRARIQKHFQVAREQLLTCSRASCPTFVRNDCAHWLKEVDAATPTIVVRARDPGGHDVYDIKVYVDDRLLQPRLDGTSVPVDPGGHKLRYELPDRSTREEEVILVEGEKDRALTLTVGSAGPTVLPAKASAASPSAGSTQATTTSSYRTGKGPWIVGGVGIAGLVGFGILQAVAQSRYSDLNGSCGMTHTCSAGDVSSLRAEFVASGIFLGVGIIGVATGVTWWLLGRDHSRESSAIGRVDGMPLPGGGLVRYEGRF
jgi:hypothetical protein